MLILRALLARSIKSSDQESNCRVSERAFLSAQPRWQRVRNKARLGAGSELRTHSNREVWQATTTKNVDGRDGVDRSACHQHQSRRHSRDIRRLSSWRSDSSRKSSAVSQGETCCNRHHAVRCDRRKWQAAAMPRDLTIPRTDQPFSSCLSSLKKRQFVPCEMIFCALLLIIPTSWNRSE